MLQQAPSHISRVCAHSHFKKVWLLQTQKESQACDNRKGSSDGKLSPLSSGATANRSSVAGTPTTALPVRPLVACGGSHSSITTGIARHTSLVTCAESLSPSVLPDSFYPSSRPSSPNIVSGDQTVGYQQGQTLVAGGENYSSFKVPRRSSSLSSPSSSRSCSPEVPHPNDCCVDHPEAVKQLPMDGSRSRSYSSDHDLSSVHEEDHQANSSGGFRDLDFGTQGSGKTICSLDVPVCSRSLTSDSSSDASSDHSTGSRDSSTGSGRSGEMPSPYHNFRFVRIERKGRRPTEAKGSLKENTDGTSCLADVNAAQSSFLRACSVCGTTKTPLWRTGPHGPKSLCNACSIRYKKAKRSAQGEGFDHAVSPLTSPGTKSTCRPLKRKQDVLIGSGTGSNRDSKSEFVHSAAMNEAHNRSLHSKVRAKPVTPRMNSKLVSPRDLVQTNSGGWLTWNSSSPSTRVPSSGPDLNKSSAFQKHIAVNRTVAKDDEEAAFLLMYLSSGLIYA